MTQKKLDELQGVGKTILTWAGIFSLIAIVVLGWDQIGRNKADTAIHALKIEALSEYAIGDTLVNTQLQKDMADVKTDVKTLLAR